MYFAISDFHIELHNNCGKQCKLITGEERQTIFSSLYGKCSLQLQREFIVRYIKVGSVGRRRTKNENSKRSVTLIYSLPHNNNTMSVYKLMFMNTLSVTERIRTALAKITPEGVLAPDRRGGQHEHLKLKDKILIDSVAAHINRFPRMESHYCRKSSREYLHPDLTIAKMYELYCTETEHQPRPVIRILYCIVFKSMNLSFHYPKKDKCSLCRTFREADEMRQKEMIDIYNEHLTEKNAVRKKKDQAKTLAKEHLEKVVYAVFDLQQVIQLPLSKESAVFYH